jgi:methyl-accepting chemotaxis protein
MKLDRKIIFAFYLINLIVMIIGILGVMSINILSSSMKEISGNSFPGVKCLLIIKEAQTSIDGSDNVFLYKKIDESTCKEYYNRIDAARKRADDAWKIYTSLPQTNEEAEVWKEFAPVWNKWLSDHDGYMNIVKEYQKNHSEAVYNKMSQYFLTTGVSLKKSEELLDKIIDMNSQAAEKETSLSDNMAKNSVVEIIIAIIAGIILSTIFGSIFIRDIARLSQNTPPDRVV